MAQQSLQLPPKVEFLGFDGRMRDFRTDEPLSAPDRRDYIAFMAWFKTMVDVYVSEGVDPEWAAAFVAQDLVRPFVQELKN